MRQSTIRVAWLAGLALGTTGGFLLLEGPVIGVPLVVAGAVIVRAAGQALAGSGGLLVGVGTIWLVLLGRMKVTCDADGPSGSCVAPGIDGYLAVAAVVLAAGIGLTVVAVRRRRAT